MEKNNQMNTKVLEINKRDVKVKANKLRSEHKVPGVIYGGSIDGGQPIYIDESLLNDILKSNTKASVIPAKFDGKNGNVVVKEVVRNPLTNFVEHIDLQAIRKNEVLTMELPIIFIGEEAIAHKRLLLNPNLNTLSVKGPADKVPEQIEVEVGELNLDDKIEVKDIKLPEGIEMLTAEDELVVSVSQSTMAKDLEQIEEEIDSQAEVQEPEVAEASKKNKEEDKEEGSKE